MPIPSVVWQLASSSGKAEREGKKIVKFTLLRIIFHVSGPVFNFLAVFYF